MRNVEFHSVRNVEFLCWLDVKFGSTALSQHFLQRSCELAHSTSNSALLTKKPTPNSALLTPNSN